MKILFFMRHAGYVRNFESLLYALAERGHEVHLAMEPRVGPRKQEAIRGGDGILEALCARYPNVTVGSAPVRRDRGWSLVVRRLRRTADYLRYLAPRYREAPALRERAESRAASIVRRIARWPLVGTPAGLRLLTRALHALERAVPACPEQQAFIAARRPDIVLITPLVEIGSPQLDYLSIARSLGLRTAWCLCSWDNLTNKGLLRDVPDLVTVWNEPLKQEAVELHGVPPERVVVTGAAPYDHWFAWRPSTTREQFCRRVGLDPHRPFLLFLGSSSFIAPAPREVRFVEGWIRRLRSAGGALAEAGVLIRPNPQNAEQWCEADLSAFGNVAVWPPGGADPSDEGARREYYDSIHHAAAVVGVNTSALIESAIVGRAVHTLLAEEFRDTQGGTLHFRHLVGAGGGLLGVARTFEEHAAQRAAALGGGGAVAAGRNRAFLEAFVRPHGLDEAATPRLVGAIEAAGAAPAPAPAPRPAWAPLLRLLLVPLVWRAERQLAAAERVAGTPRRARVA